MLDRRVRATVERGLRPVAGVLRRAGMSPDAFTALGLLTSVGTALLLGFRRPGWAVVTLTLSGLTDVLDGSVAKASGRASKRGAFFDSVCDRLSDALMFGGVAWYLADDHPRSAVLALAVLALSLIISYERARAESLGFEARGGLMERAERMVVLGIGLTFSWVIEVLWIMLALTAVTVVHRFVKVWNQATVEMRAEQATRRPPAVESSDRRSRARRQPDESRPARRAGMRLSRTRP